MGATPHDRRHPRHRGAGHEHLPAYTEEQQVARCRSEQVGPRARQGPEGHRHLRQRHTQPHGPVHRFPHRVRLGAYQAAHFQGARDGHGGLYEPQDKDRNYQAQRSYAAPYRGFPATINQGKVHQDKVLLAAAQHADTLVRVLRQPAAVRQGALQAFPGEQDTRQLEAYRLTYQHFHKAEITKTCSWNA